MSALNIAQRLNNYRNRLYGSRARYAALFLFLVFAPTVLIPPATVWARAAASSSKKIDITKEGNIPALGVADSKNKPAADEKLGNSASSKLGINTRATEALKGPSYQKSKITPHELVEKRTATSETYVEQDGSYKTREYFAPKYYKQDKQWKNIDTSLTEDKNAGDSGNVLGKAYGQVQSVFTEEKFFMSKENDWRVRFAPSSFKKGMVRFTYKGETLGVKPVDANNVKPVITKGQNGKTYVRYLNLWNNIDVEYEVTTDQVKENIIFRSKKAASSVRFWYTDGELKERMADGLKAFDLKGVLGDTFSVNAPNLILNNYGPETDNKKSGLSQEAYGSLLQVGISSSYLSSLADDAFPVVIDPGYLKSTIGDRKGGSYGAYKSDGYVCGSSTCNVLAGSLRDSNNIWRSWRGVLYAPYNRVRDNNGILTGANLHITRRTGVSFFTGDSSGHWFTAWYAPYLGQYNCMNYDAPRSAAWFGDMANINVTDIYRWMIDRGEWGGWLAVTGEEVAGATYKNFDPDPYGTFLEFGWVIKTPTPSITSPVNDQVFIDPQASFTANQVNNPNTSTPLKYNFCITRSPGCGSPVITSNDITANQWTVPDGVLQDGETYYVQVRALDPDGGAGYSPYSGAVKFRIDMRRGKDKTQTYDDVGPVSIDLATGNLSTGNTSHTSTALGGELGISVDYNSPMRSRTGLVGQYFNNTNWSGSPSVTRVDQNIDFNWATGSPASGIGTDNFSIRWTGYVTVPQSGTYSFGSEADDGTRITVNNQVLYEQFTQWNLGIQYGSSVYLTAGQVVPITIEHKDAYGGAYIKLYVKGPVNQTGMIVPKEWFQTGVRQVAQDHGLTGSYYYYDSARNLDATTNNLFLRRVDPIIATSWGDGPAVPGGPNDFMVRWTGYINIPTTGSYTFGTDADDGSRIKIDNNAVFDNWNACCSLVYGGATTLTAGMHSITVDLYDSGGGARIGMFVKGAVPEQTVPSSWLYPSAQVLPNGWELGIDPDGDLSYDRLTANTRGITLMDSTGDTHEYTWTGSGYKPPVNEDGQLTRNNDGTYTLADVDGRTYVFNQSGILTSVTTPTDDRKPAALKYDYSGSPAKIKQITDGVDPSRYAKVYYAGDAECSSAPLGFDVQPPVNMLCAVITNDGRRTDFYYLSGNLARITKPGNDSNDYQYDTLGRIVAIRTSLANDVISAGLRAADDSVLTQISYDNLGRAVSVKAPSATAGGVRQEQRIDYKVGITEQHVVGDTEPNGFSRKVDYDNLFRTTKDVDVTGKTTTTEWDANKDLVYATTDATGLKATTVYDDEDRPTDSYGPAPAAWFTASGRNQVPLSAYVSRVPRTSTAYDEGMRGLAVTVFGNKGLTGNPISHRTGINSDGTIYTNLQASGIVPANVSTTGWGMTLTGKIKLPEVGNHTFGLYGDDGARLYIDDNLIVNDWNAGGKRDHGNGVFNNTVANSLHRVRIDYFDTGNGDAWLEFQKKTPTGAWTWQFGDLVSPDYSLTTSQTAYGVPTTNGQTATVKSTTNYGPNPEYGLVQSASSDVTNTNLTATSTYETPGSGFLRQTSSTLPGGATTNYSYYGATETRQNPCDTTKTYKQAGMLKTKTEPDPDGAGSQTPRTIETVYDDTGNVVATRYNSDAWTCTTYDVRERVLSTIIPAYNGQAARTITNTYEVNDNPLITSSSDNNGTITVEIDLLGRNVKYTDAMGNVTTSTYDNQGHLIQRNSPLGQETFLYDQYDRLTDQKLDNIQYAHVTYDEYSRMVSVDYPNGQKLTLGRESTTDSLGRVNKRSYTLANNQTLSDEVTRAVTGDITGGIELGQTKSYGYDTAGHLTSATIAGTTYTYGFGQQDTSCNGLPGSNPNSAKSSNRTSQSLTTPGLNGGTTTTSTTYCYDQADRLIASSSPIYDNPVYDSHGNTTSLGKLDSNGNGTVTNFTYDSSDRNVGIQETKTQDTPAVLDPQTGQETTPAYKKTTTTTTTYTRDVQGRITSRTYTKTENNKTPQQQQNNQPGTTTNLDNTTSYYGFTASGDTPDFITDGQTTPQSPSGNVVEKYLSLAGDVLLTLRPNRTSAGSQTFSLPNIHGDIFATLDADGTVLGTYVTGPFGEVLGTSTNQSNNQQTTNVPWNTTTNSSFQYVGQHEKITEASLATNPIQMGARVYLPSIGRFLQVDPVPGGTDNPYVYPDDPVNDFDLTGEFGWKRVFKAAAVCGAIGSMIPGPVGIVAAGVSAAAYAAAGDRKKAGEMVLTAALAGVGAAGIAKGLKMAGNAGLNKVAARAWSGGAKKMTEHFVKHGADMGYKTKWGYTVGAYLSSIKAGKSFPIKSGSRAYQYKNHITLKYGRKVASYMTSKKWINWARNNHGY